MQEQANDEIRLYLNTYYISASEALWRIFHYRLYYEKLNIIQLYIHLSEQHEVIFQDDKCLEDVVEYSDTEMIILIA